MTQINKIKFLKIREFLLLLSVTSFIVLFDFNMRWLILIYSPYVFLKIVDDFKYKNFKVFFIIITFVFLLFIHLGINNYIYNFEISKKQFISTFVIGYIAFFTYYFYYDIINSKKNLIYIFFILFILSSLIGIFNLKLDNPTFCGGLKNIFFSASDIYNIGTQYFFKYELGGSEDKIDRINLSFGEYLFKENSHLGMIAPSFILFFLYTHTNEKLYSIKFFLFYIFLLLCFIKSSTTLLLGLFVSSLVILIFQYKRLNKKFITILIFLALIISIIFINDKECKKRVYYQDNFKKIVNSYPSPIDNSTEALESNKKDNFLSKFFNVYSGNISSKVFWYNLKLSIFSIYENPLGWGFQNYSNAHEYLSNKYFRNKKNFDTVIIQFNNKDGSNNLNKIIVEFGIFGIFVYFFIIIYILSSKVSISEKIFLLPFIITQSLRGGGYFNAGFILIIFLIFMSYINRNESNK